MLRFSSIADLKKVVDAAAITHSVGVDMSAARCMLVRQLSFDTTEFTSIEVARATFSFLYKHTADSGGEPGEEYLLDFASFRQRINAMKESAVKSVTIQLIKGIVRLKADYSVDEQGVAREKGNLAVRQYMGPITDLHTFAPVNNLVASISAEEWFSWVKTCSDFGEFKEKYEGPSFGKLIKVDLSANTLRTNVCSGAFHGAYLLIEKTAAVVRACNFAFEGRLLSRLNKITLTDEVQIYEDSAGLVTFKGGAGTVTCVTMAAPPNMLRDEQLLAKFMGESICTRAVSLPDLISAVAMQGAIATSDLALLEDKALYVAQANNITSEEYSLVAIEPSNVVGDWKPLEVSSIGLAAILKALSSISSTVYIQTQVTTRPSGTKVWLVYLTLEVGVIGSLSGLLFAKEATLSDES